MNSVVQVQAVLYKSKFDSIARSISSLSNSALHTGFSIEFAYGDASEKPCLTDKELNSLRALTPFRVSYTYFGENTGYGKGQNLLARDSRSDFLLAINPDILVEASFFYQLIYPFDNQRNIGIVEARQTPLEHPKAYDCETGETSWCSGACMLVPTDLFLRLGGFDFKSFWMYCEDVDFSWRVKIAGKKLIYRPQAPVFHPKRLTKNGDWIPTKTEIYQSALAGLMMAYKWSNNKRLNQLINLFKNSTDPSQREALNAFNSMKDNGNLPTRIKASRNIATFSDDGDYSDRHYL